MPSPSSHQLLMDAMQLELDLYDAEGVTDEDLEARLQAFFGDADDKMGRIRYAREHFKARAALLRAQATRLTDEARVAEARVVSCEQAALSVMEGRIRLLGPKEGRTFSDDYGKVFTRAIKVVKYEMEVLDFLDLHGGRFVRLKPELNRSEVADALKSGEEIEGAALREKLSVQFK